MIESTPGGRVLVEHVAEPAASTVTAEQIAVPAAEKVTVPTVAGEPPAATVAVKATGSVYTATAGDAVTEVDVGTETVTVTAPDDPATPDAPL